MSQFLDSDGYINVAEFIALARDIASEVLKLKIKAIFDGENPTKPLSDQKVVEILARENLTVARRTVTKYREMLGIEPSSKRKQKD
jgi:RNA polymerase sigma-54 factor